MQKLNEKENAVLAYLIREIAERGYAPSVRDICAALGYASTSTVQAYLERLEQYGYIRREDGKSRSIVLCESLLPQRIILEGASEGEDEASAYVPNFLYCGPLAKGEAPIARLDGERREYVIYVGSRRVARLKLEDEN